MRIHEVIDYSFLYYKYKFQLDSGKMKRLTHQMEWNGETVDKDISQIYYSIKEIEKFRKDCTSRGNECTTSVCFDMPSARKDGDSECAAKYKSNRTSKLTEEDFENITFVKNTLNSIGYNTYRFDGTEADDIVSFLANTYADNYDYTVIYTPDADLLINVKKNVIVSRYKVMRGYQTVNLDNFSEYLSKEMKCYIPYNALMLFKCCVGDKSDCIDGIHGFGPKAFDKLVSHLDLTDVNWPKCGTYQATRELLDDSAEYLGIEQLDQALNSLSLVRPMVFEDGQIHEPIDTMNENKRKEVYTELGMVSLI